jgi:hypothetical protein
MFGEMIGRKRRTDDNAREAGMLGASRGNSTWARNFLAIRIVPTLACEFMPDAEIHDAANLVRRGARFGALAMATGRLTGDWEDLRVTLLGVETLRAEPVGPPSETVLAADPERVLLHGAADELMRLSNPLLVSVGGRRLDVPFLRYRCMAARIPLPALHMSLNGRLCYFDRFDSNWHVDLADLLSGFGNSRPLGLAELCRLVGLEAALEKNAASPLLRADTEVRAIVALFLRTLMVLGRLDSRQTQRVEESIWEEAEPRQDPLSVMPAAPTARVGFG